MGSLGTLLGTLTTAPTETESTTGTSRFVAPLLENLSMQFVEASNGNYLDPTVKDRLNAISILNNEVQTDNPKGGYKNNPRAHVAKLWEFAMLNPEWRVDARNISSTIDEAKGIGFVFVVSTLTGYFADLACERVCRIKWRRRRGIWRAVEIHILRGGGQGLT